MATSVIMTAPDLREYTPAREWKRYALPVMVVAGLLLVQMVYFTGVISSDDMSYLAPAIDARDGQVFTPESIHAYDCHCFARFVYWKMVQGAVTLFPEHPWAMALPSILAAFASSLIVFSIAGRFFNRQTALLAMTMYGVVPVVVCSASVAVPDLVAGAFAWSGVYLVAGAVFSGERCTRSVIYRCAFGGLVIAAGYNAKEIVALFIPAMMLAILAARFRSARARWAVLSLGIGAACWLIIEAVVLWSWTGDWLFHAHAVKISQRGYELPPIYPTVGGYLMYLTDYLRWLCDPRQDFGFVGPMMVAGCVWACWKRTAFTGLLLAVVVMPLIYLTVGTTELADYRPIVHQQRYLVPLIPGMSILAAGMIMSLWRVRSRAARSLLMAMAVVMLLTTLILPNRHAGKWYHAATFNAAYQLFSQRNGSVLNEGGATLLAGHFTASRLDLLRHWIEIPDVQRLQPPFPANAEAWIEQYPGRIVCVSANDRTSPSKAKHGDLTLFGPAMDSLAGFPRVAVSAPPRDRLSRLGALILRQPVSIDPAFRVELIRIPEGPSAE